MFVNRATLRSFNHSLNQSAVRVLGRNPAQDLTRGLAAVRPCNDNQRLLSTASRRRVRRPKLSCRWRTVPAGGLECVWQTDRQAASAGEEPGISRKWLPRWIGICGFPATINVAGKLHCAVIRSERLDSIRASFFNSNRSGVSVFLIGKRESGATLAWSLVRSCPRNCQRRAIFPTCHWALPSKVWEGGKWRRPASQETCWDDVIHPSRGARIWGGFPLR